METAKERRPQPSGWRSELRAAKESAFARFLKNENSGELNILDSISDIEVLHLEKSYGFYKTLTEKEKRGKEAI